jgi:hypothetical protein
MDEMHSPTIAAGVLDPAERPVLARFDQARGRGAAERTALSLAAWAWLHHHSEGTFVQARREVGQILRRHGRRVAM